MLTYPNVKQATYFASLKCISSPTAAKKSAPAKANTNFNFNCVYKSFILFKNLERYPNPRPTIKPTKF